MRIFLEPNESLSFRTGRPFDAGENNYAESMFPPTPETLQGALRATIATHWDRTKTLDEVFQDENLTNIIGNHLSYERDNYGRFRITGMSLGRRKKEKEDEIERLFPVPAYLISDDKGKLRLRPKHDEGVTCDREDSMLFLLPEGKTKGKLKPISGWLTEDNLYHVLHATADLTKLEIVKLHDIYEREPRMGIGMQNTTKTTKEGLLYYMHMVRMQPGYGFVIDIHLSDSPNSNILIDDNQTQKKLRLPSKGWITLGGERRASRFEVIDISKCGQGINVEHREKGTLLYLATPAYFDGGWQPKTWSAPLVKPIAAAVDRYKPIGGWLLHPNSNGGGANKIIRRCVPAGSVYFFDKSVTITQPLTEFGSHIGYGITYAGEW